MSNYDYAVFAFRDPDEESCVWNCAIFCNKFLTREEADIYIKKMETEDLEYRKRIELAIICADLESLTSLLTRSKSYHFMDFLRKVEEGKDRAFEILNEHLPRIFANHVPTVQIERPPIGYNLPRIVIEIKKPNE